MPHAHTHARTHARTHPPTHNWLLLSAKTLQYFKLEVQNCSLTDIICLYPDIISNATSPSLFCPRYIYIFYQIEFFGIMRLFSISQHNSTFRFHGSFTCSGLISIQYLNSIIQFEKLSEIQKAGQLCVFVSQIPIYPSLFVLLVLVRLTSGQQYVLTFLDYVREYVCMRHTCHFWTVYDVYDSLFHLVIPCF